MQHFKEQQFSILFCHRVIESQNLKDLIQVDFPHHPGARGPRGMVSELDNPALHTLCSQGEGQAFQWEGQCQSAFVEVLF